MIINEIDIKRLNNKYNFNKCELFGDVLYIDSQFDTWIAEDYGNFIMLKHQNKWDKKNRTHVQRCYRDLDFMFQSIAAHDRYKAV